MTQNTEQHDSDCAMHNEPAFPNGPCDCRLSQNTEQNVRTQSLQIAGIVERVTDLSLVNCYPDFGEVQDWMIEAEARGAEEQRRKDAEAQDPVAYQVRDMRGGTWTWKQCSANAHEEYKKYSTVETRELFDRPANVAALEAEIASLKEAEQLAWADAEASKARVRKLESYLRRIDYWSHEERGSTDEQRVACVRNLISRAALTREGGV